MTHRTHVHRTGGIPLHALLSHKDLPERTAAAIHRPQHRTRKGNTESVQESYLTFRKQQKTDKGHRGRPCCHRGIEGLSIRLKLVKFVFGFYEFNALKSIDLRLFFVIYLCHYPNRGSGFSFLRI